MRHIVARGGLLASLVAIGLAASIIAPNPSTSAAPALKYWEGTVTKVVDGDTLFVDIKGDGTSRSFEVRNAGIQATETAHPDEGIPKDECHSLQAKKRMAELVFGKHRHVRLSAFYPSSRASGRLLRYVEVDVQPGPGTTWVDTQQVLLSEGLVLWKPENVEVAHNASYHVVAQEAMRRGKQLYDPDYRKGACAKGPFQAMPLTMTLNYNGFDARKGNQINGEWIKIRNHGTKDVSISGWLFRDASHNHYLRFPKGATIRSKDSVLIRAGAGHATKSTFYWNRSTNPFAEPIEGHAFPGRATYLFDRDGDLRAYADYPCVAACSDPLRGQVEISSVNYAAPGADVDNPNGEYVDLRSTGGTVDLSGYVFERHPFKVILPPGTRIGPGDALRIKMGPGSNDLQGPNLVVHLGADRGILTDAGQTVVLRTWNAIRIVCTSWGNQSC